MASISAGTAVQTLQALGVANSKVSAIPLLTFLQVRHAFTSQGLDCSFAGTVLLKRSVATTMSWTPARRLSSGLCNPSEFLGLASTSVMHIEASGFNRSHDTSLVLTVLRCCLADVLSWPCAQAASYYGSSVSRMRALKRGPRHEPSFLLAMTVFVLAAPWRR